VLREILTYPNPILSQKAERVSAITAEIKELARDMAETMYANKGVGLAAPQVGRSIRLITADATGPDKREGLITLINPEIIASEGEGEGEEGCLSVEGYRSNVVRAEKVKVRGLSLDGQEIILDAEELLSVCLQHEIDHLDGTLFIDRISRLKRSLYDRRLTKWRKRKKSSE
jgi:peptide deformylase